MRVFLDANLLIYLNTAAEETRRSYEDFYTELAANNRLYTDVLVLDELLYVSRRRYNVPYPVTAEFIDDVVLPFTEILPLGLPEYHASVEMIEEARLKPSDALHLASMRLNGIETIASEDQELDKASKINRVWLTRTHP